MTIKEATLSVNKDKMNSTSFTSIESDCASSQDKIANIDSSSTAHLTLNAALNRPIRSTTGSNNSDSDPDASPSVKVLTTSDATNLTSSINNLNHHHPHHHHHNHLHHSLTRPTQLITGGFSLSNRLHLTKHQRTLWSRASSFEKLLMLAVLVLGTTTLLLFMTLVSIFMSSSQKIHHESTSTPTTTLHNQTTSGDVNSLNNNNNNTTTISDQSTTAAAACQHQQQQQIFNNSSSNSINTQSNATLVVDDQSVLAKKNYCLRPDCVKVAASVIEAIDLTVDPCDDFYMYSCGDWIKSNPLPDGKSNWGTFSKLWQDNQLIMRSVLEGANFKPGSAEEKAKIYYESCLDRNDTVELRGTKPMQDLIESAGGWNISGPFDVKKWDLQSSLQIYHNQYNRGGLFSWAVGADERNSTRNIIQLDQGGLGLPSRDYYLNKTDKNVLDAYLSYMIKVAELMGGTNVEDQMKEILEFEMKLAAITIPQDQRRDDERMYHKFNLKELSNRSSFLNWTKYFDDAFDYHSRTTISYSSEIRPHVSLNETQFKIQNALNNQTTYSVASPAPSDSSTPSSIEATTPPITTTNNQEQNSDPSNKQPLTISKHKITEDENIVIYSPEYFDYLSELITHYASTEKGKVTLANYMAWSVIQSLIATLPKNFRDASKVLRKALIGSEGIEVSWRYCVTDTNTVMGFALGSLFVRRVFQGQSKERAEEMIYSIRNAFKDNLPNLNWMDDRTRMLAREKADHINQMIGFPDFILNPEKLNGKYEGLELDENNYFENNIKVNVLSLRENMEKINKPANKTEWEMTPPMVNAYYTPTKNQIVFPAGILQTPFYDLSYPNSLNYGAMGVVMGHELTHAFDDQGREYDKDGNLYQWWYNETLKNFEERVKCFVDQYSSYKVDDSHLNGKQTLGENIADNGGLKAAFRAFEKWSDANPEPQLPGLNLTSKQLFFVGFAQVWCSISTPEALKLQVLNDPHAPAQFRVIGTLSNSQEFAREFNCASGTKMNPDKKCVVW